MWIKSFTIAVGLIAIVASGVPFLLKKLGSDNSESVMTHTIARGSLNVTVTENGMLESSNNEEIKCFVKGGSTVLWVIETGTIVKPGDELVRLDDSVIVENITQQQITCERAVANKIIAQSNVDVAETNIEEYLYGTYLQERNTIEKDIFDANERVKKTQLAYESAMRMASKGLYRTLQLEGEKFAADSAKKDLELKEKQLETLDLYRKKKTMQELQSNLDAAKARLAAEEASLRLEKSRLDRDKQQLVNCVIKAEAEGMVIFPSAAEWKETPDIEEGAHVREQQTLLMIPDVSKMQVKVGVHESKVSRLRVGMPAKVQLQDMTLEGEIDTIAEVTRPAGWWTGNMVKYDTIIKLAHTPGLKPGMSAVVDIVLAQYDDELKIPVAAIVGNGEQFLCWVKTAGGVQKQVIELGDTNDEFTIVTAGLRGGEEVVLNPWAFIDEAQLEAMRPTKDTVSKEDAGGAEKEVTGTTAAATEVGGKKPKAPTAPRKKATTQGVGAKIIAAGDQNGDGFLTEDEFQEKDRASFPEVDANGDGKVDAAELDAAITAASGG